MTNLQQGELQMQKRLYPDETNYGKGFLLNLLILADAFEERYNIINYLPKDSRPTLKGIRHYRLNPSPQIGYVYLVAAADVDEHFRFYQNINFIVIGKVDVSLFSNNSSLIVLDDNCSMVDVFDYSLHIFSIYSSWDMALQKALVSETPLDDMLKASLEIFQNPLFIHDTEFYILACPKNVDGMTVWSVDPKTGRYMVPLNVINDLKIDTEYLNTLKMRHVDMFSANQRGYRILYCNLWNGTRYEGRICINELQSVIKHGDYLTLEYLAKMVTSCITRRNTFWMGLGHDVEQICKQILSRQITEEREIRRLLRFLDWGIEDTYLIIKLGTEHTEMDYRFTASAFGYIESQVSASHAFFYQEGIVIIVNLTVSKATPSQVISSLSYLVREGLFKIGVSNEFSDFTHLPYAYQQAAIALEYGGQSESMIWCFHYKDYALQYIFDKACHDIPFEYICAKQIKDLQKYDDKHNTKLNETLDTYLRLERNVVQTSKTLFIHRSTLFYRLDRIQKIIDVDLNDPATRLYLSISYHMSKTN